MSLIGTSLIGTSLIGTSLIGTSLIDSPNRYPPSPAIQPFAPIASCSDQWNR